MEDLRKRVRILELYCVVSVAVFGGFLFTGFAGAKKTFDEVTVERLNVIEKNGQLRAVIANSDRMPDPVIDGKSFKAERPPGLVFYNGIGDECGGLVFGAAAKGQKYGAYGGFTFDQYKQSQTIGLVSNDHNGVRQVGLNVWDRSETPLSEIYRRAEIIENMPAGPERDAARKQLREEDGAPRRVFVGRNQEREATVILHDPNGRPRLRMVVDAAGHPRLDFLDENGRVTRSLTDSAMDAPGKK